MRESVGLESRWREAWLTAQNEAFEAAINGQPLAVSLGLLIDTAVEQSGGDLRCAFYLANKAHTELAHLAGMPPSYAECVDGFRIGPDSFACGLATYAGQPVITPDVRTEPRWQKWLWLAEQYDYRGCWSFPLQALSGKVLGTLAMYFRSPRDPSPRDYELAGLMTRAAAIIVARMQDEDALRALNDRLEARVRERTTEIDALLARLITIQEEERRRIARNIHDQLGQQMTALRMNLEALRAKADGNESLVEQVDRTRRLAEELDRSIDGLTWELRPAALDHHGLSAGLAHLVAAWSERVGIETDFEAVGIDGSRFPPDVETNLYRLTQEALQNVYKHANATRVSVVLELRDGLLILVLEDDGAGFTESAGDGFGLLNMRERAVLAGGALAIESSPGNGTTVIARVPVGRSAAAAGRGREPLRQ